MCVLQIVFMIMITHLINESSTALTNLPHPCRLMHWASLRGRPQHERGHASSRI